MTRKQAASGEAPDGSHLPGRAERTSTAGPEASSGATATPTPAATATGTKISAQYAPEADRAHAYQCTDALECPAKEIPLMEPAKKIVAYANVVDMIDETVNGNDIKKHPGPIIHEKERS